jgi:hypothetical protein
MERMVAALVTFDDAAARRSRPATIHVVLSGLRVLCVLRGSIAVERLEPQRTWSTMPRVEL